jgi:ABC-2 type transport system ATP-binding protein
MIETNDLRKTFGPVSAVQGVSFEIKKGEIVGFLGPNGAGKTTLMRILTTYLAPTSGTAVVAGYDTRTQAFKAREKIGYLPETPPLYEYLTVMEYLRFAARIKGVSPRQVKLKIDKVLDQCLLKDVAGRRIGDLSKGYKQRAGLAQAIIHDPEVLILDEPTSGLDPVQNKAVRDLIKGLEFERTVILSTHILSEIVHLARRVLIINKGEIVRDENLDKLLRTPEGRRRLSLRFRGPQSKVYQITSSPGGPRLLGSSSLGDVHVLDLELTSEPENYNALLQTVMATGVEILSVQEKTVSLEDVFFDVIGCRELC